MGITAKSLDARRYTETFAVFLNRSHEYPAVIDQLVAVAEACPPDYTCLDIGAGTGKVILDWKSRGTRLPSRYVAIEPFDEHVRSLRETLSKLDLESDLLESEFGPEFEIPGNYDLIVLSHSCYWLTDPVQCLINAHGALKAGGTLIAILQSPIGGYPFFNLFNPSLERDRRAGPDHSFSSYELTQGLRSAGLSPIVEFESSWMDLTGLFSAGAIAECDEFVSFLLQVEFSLIEDPFRTDVIEYLKAACMEVDGKQLWLHPTAAVKLSDSTT